MMLKHISSKIGKKIEAKEFKFNQFTGDIEIVDMVVYSDMEGTEVLATLGSGRIKINFGDLLQEKVNISSATVADLMVKQP